MVKKLTAKEKQSLSPSSPPSLAKKTKMAVWFVSNCVSRSGRGKVAKHLQSYLPVNDFLTVKSKPIIGTSPVPIY